MKHLEFILQKSVCQYITNQYPNVLFLSDTVANIKLAIPQQVRNKAIQKQGFKCPDIIIFEPNNYYKGLFIELKHKCPFKKNGDLKKNEHLFFQQKTMMQLEEKGYKCFFSWNFEMTKKIIDDYIKNKTK